MEEERATGNRQQATINVQRSTEEEEKEEEEI